MFPRMNSFPRPHARTQELCTAVAARFIFAASRQEHRIDRVVLSHYVVRIRSNSHITEGILGEFDLQPTWINVVHFLREITVVNEYSAGPIE